MKIKKVHILKAQPIADIPVKSVTIIMDSTVPNAVSLEAARQGYTVQAQMLADVLFTTLPGGTIDALLIEMMKRKASLFSIPFIAPEAVADD